MRMKLVCDDHTVWDVTNGISLTEKTQKVRQQIWADCNKHIDKFPAQS